MKNREDKMIATGIQLCCIHVIDVKIQKIFLS